MRVMWTGHQLVIYLPSWRNSFLGQVDLYGTAFQDSTLATGYGAHIARPLMRKAYRPDLSEEEARKVLEDCMRVMFYRDARTINKIQLAKVRSPHSLPSTATAHLALIYWFSYLCLFLISVPR